MTAQPHPCDDVSVSRPSPRWTVLAALAGCVVLLAAMVVVGAPPFARGPGPDPDGELVVTVPVPPSPAPSATGAPPQSVWPAGQGDLDPIAPTASEVAHGFVREYLGLADAVVLPAILPGLGTYGSRWCAGSRTPRPCAP